MTGRDWLTFVLGITLVAVGCLGVIALYQAIVTGS